MGAFGAGAGAGERARAATRTARALSLSLSLSISRPLHSLERPSLGTTRGARPISPPAEGWHASRHWPASQPASWPGQASCAAPKRRSTTHARTHARDSRHARTRTSERASERASEAQRKRQGSRKAEGPKCARRPLWPPKFDWAAGWRAAHKNRSSPGALGPRFALEGPAHLARASRWAPWPAPPPPGWQTQLAAPAEPMYARAPASLAASCPSGLRSLALGLRPAALLRSPAGALCSSCLRARNQSAPAIVPARFGRRPRLQSARRVSRASVGQTSAADTKSCKVNALNNGAPRSWRRRSRRPLVRLQSAICDDCLARARSLARSLARVHACMRRRRRRPLRVAASARRRARNWAGPKSIDFPIRLETAARNCIILRPTKGQLYLPAATTKTPTSNVAALLVRDAARARASFRRRQTQLASSRRHAPLARSPI